MCQARRKAIQAEGTASAKASGRKRSVCWMVREMVGLRE